MKQTARKLRKFKYLYSLVALLLLLITIPFVLWAIYSQESFDPTSRASDLKPATDSCTVKFAYVNPQTIEVDKNVQLVITARSTDKPIDSLKIATDRGAILLEKSYGSFKPYDLTEQFTFTPKDLGAYKIVASYNTAEKTINCNFEGATSAASFLVIAKNTAPIFTTNPYKAAKPSNVLAPNTAYQYTLEATDADSDKIEYSYSFTRGESWLGMQVLSDGRDGKLKLQFDGTPTKEGSYLANVFMYDGYRDHLRSQSWVVSVESSQNDTPVITFKTELDGKSVVVGTPIIVEWEIADRNEIVTNKIYLATNPSDPGTWLEVNTDLAGDRTAYEIPTTDIKPGHYSIIIQAIDNQNPPATGIATSELIAITDKDGNISEEPSDGVQLDVPQILNIEPANNSTVSDPRKGIKASLLASSGEKVNVDTIIFKVDGVDLTKQTAVAPIDPARINLSYVPDKDLSSGSHSVEIEFKDTADRRVTKSWSFNVDTDEDDSRGIFGFSLNGRTLTIIGIGLGLIILALVVPWLLYLAWRRTAEEENEIVITKISEEPIQTEKIVTTTTAEELVPTSEVILTPPIQTEIIRETETEVKTVTESPQLPAVAEENEVVEYKPAEIIEQSEPEKRDVTIEIINTPAVPTVTGVEITAPTISEPPPPAPLPAEQPIQVENVVNIAPPPPPLVRSLPDQTQSSSISINPMAQTVEIENPEEKVQIEQVTEGTIQLPETENAETLEPITIDNTPNYDKMPTTQALEIGKVPTVAVEVVNTDVAADAEEPAAPAENATAPTTEPKNAPENY